MIEYNINTYKILLYENNSCSIFGEIINQTLNKRIFLMKIRDEDTEAFDKYNLTYMSSIINSKETTNKLISKLTNNEDLTGYEKEIENIQNELKKIAIILVNESTTLRILKGDKYAISILFHEIGHIIHNDEQNKNSINRLKNLKYDEVDKRELSADMEAYNIIGEQYYDAMKSDYDMIVNVSDNTSDLLYLLIKKEMGLRLEALAKEIINDKNTLHC